MRFRLPSLRGNPRAEHGTLHDNRAPSLRVRGWTVAFGLGLLLWAVVAGVIVLVVTLLR